MSRAWPKSPRVWADVEAVQGVEVERGRRQLAAGPGGLHVQSAELPPTPPPPRGHGAPVPPRHPLLRSASAQYSGLLYVPAPGLPPAERSAASTGYGEACGGGAVGVHLPFVRRGSAASARWRGRCTYGCGDGEVRSRRSSRSGSTTRTPKWSLSAVQARQGAAKLPCSGSPSSRIRRAVSLPCSRASCAPRRWSSACGRRVCCGWRRRWRRAGR